jgi:hypothetical protein
MSKLRWVEQLEHRLKAESAIPSSFAIQGQTAKYWVLCCRVCSLAWYLPKDSACRTKDAATILARHAAAHGETGADDNAQHVA